MNQTIVDQSSRLSQVIFEYAGKIGREQDLDSLLVTIADLGRDLTGADRCSIWLCDEQSEQLFTRVAHGVGRLTIPWHSGIAGYCFRTSETVLSNDARTDSRLATAVDSRTGYQTQSVLAVPVRDSAGRTIGVFQALNKPRGFEHRDQDLLSLAAAYSATTLETQSLLRKAESARKLGREMEIAREVQQRLLAPNLGGMGALKNTMEFHGICHPAAEVGGDYYYCAPLPDGGLLAALGDVSGKGIAAALMMATIHGNLHALVVQMGWKPAMLMTRLNELVYESSTASRYSTMVLAHFDPESATLTTVNAGHVSPVLLLGGTPVELPSDGPPIGLFPSAEFSSQTHRLASGDTLLCFSDGLTEAQNEAGEMLPEDLFRSAIRDASGLSAKESAEHLAGAAIGFTGGATLADDLTVISLRVSEPPRSPEFL